MGFTQKKCIPVGGIPTGEVAATSGQYPGKVGWLHTRGSAYWGGLPTRGSACLGDLATGGWFCLDGDPPWTDKQL